MSAMMRLGLAFALLFALSARVTAAPAADTSMVPAMGKELIADPLSNAVLEVGDEGMVATIDEPEREIDVSEKAYYGRRGYRRHYNYRRCNIDMKFKTIGGKWGGFPNKICSHQLTNGFKFKVTGASWGSVTVYTSFGRGTSHNSPHRFRVRPRYGGIRAGTYYFGAYPRCGHSLWKKMIVEDCPSESPSY